MARMHGETAAAYAQRRAFEAERKRHVYTPGPPVEIPILCSCLSWRHPHELSAHKKLKNEGEWPSAEKREVRERYRQEWDRSLR